MENEFKLVNGNEGFIEMVTKGSPELEKILGKIVENRKIKKNRPKEIAAITKEILSSGVATIDDDSEITYGDLYTSMALANTFKDPENVTLKDLQDLQKVTGESSGSDSGVVINLITGGQDLGD